MVAMNKATDSIDLPPGVTALADFRPNGPSTSAIFELKRPVQYLFNTYGNSAVPPASRARTMLYDHAAARSYEVAAAEIGFGLDRNFPIQTAGSLLLGPGRYSWFSEVNPQPFDQIAGCYLRADAVNSPEPILTRGLRQVASAVSGAAGRKVYARASVDAKIPDTEPFSAQITVVNLMTGAQLATPMLQGIGPTEGLVEIGVVPYVLTAGHVYRATFIVNYNGPGTVSSALLQANS